MLPRNVLAIIDVLARAARHLVRRIEETVRRRPHRRRLRAHERERLDSHAKALDAEGDDSAGYQAAWEPE
ncbi:MAG TPA: hypothetical protein VK733_03615 [Gemmatimonadaceae bacterium]|nr:hypothetical protein [Gemmatimonadaceae bacterium]